MRSVVLASALPKLFTAGIDSVYLFVRHMSVLLTYFLVPVSALTNMADTNLDAVSRGVKLREHILVHLFPALNLCQFSQFCQEFQSCISAIEECRQPVIAAAHGLGYGLAVDILCACDIRFAAADSVFSIKVS